jgi:L-gulonolactone oxidase
MWTNWTGDQSCSPLAEVSPTSVDQVATIVTQAAERGENVRVVGAGHAFGDTVVTDGTLMTLDRLKGIYSVDRETGLVRAAAGTRLHEMNALLDIHGLAFENLGDINVQSLAGAISTATHGSGAAFGNREVSGDDLRAARVSVGALGVVTAYTLRTVPAFRLRERRDRVPLDRILAELDDRVARNDHFEFFVFPHAQKVLTKELNRTSEPVSAHNERLSYLQEVVVENRVLDLVSRMGRRRTRAIPRLNRAVTALAGTVDHVDVSHRIFSTPREVRFTETEWAFPQEACADALRDILRLIGTRGFDVNFPLEVRFVAADTDSMLSPSYGRPTAYIAAHMYQGMPWQAYFDAVEEVAAAYGARPHWGKRHTLDAAALRQRYPEWDDFQEVRTRLDPTGVFANAHVRRIFG